MVSDVLEPDFLEKRDAYVRARLLVKASGLIEVGSGRGRFSVYYSVAGLPWTLRVSDHWSVKVEDDVIVNLVINRRVKVAALERHVRNAIEAFASRSMERMSGDVTSSSRPGLDDPRTSSI